MGLGDELRAVARVDGACWGYLCLHREAGHTFSSADARYVRQLAPQMADAIRAEVRAAHSEGGDDAGAPGLLLVSPDGTLISSTAAGERWLYELGRPEAELVATILRQDYLRA